MEGKVRISAQQLDGQALLRLFWRSKWLVLVVMLLSALATYAVCALIPPLYESHLIMVPGSSVSRDKQIEEFRYGYDADSERLMQFLGSDVILDSLESKFDLARTWGIDKAEKQWYDRFVQQAKARIIFHKTRHSSVVVSVQDEDPERAAAVANETFRLVNALSSGIVKENARQVLESVEQEFNSNLGIVTRLDDSIGTVQFANSNVAIQRLELEKKLAEQKVTRLRDSLQALRSRHQIYDYGYQVNVLNEQLAEARATYLQESGAFEVLGKLGQADTLRLKTQARLTGAQRRVEYFEVQLRSLSHINSRYASLLDELELENENIIALENQLNRLRQSIEPKVASRQLSRLENELDFDRMRLEELKAKYESAMANYLHPLPLAHIVSPARPSYTKIYPKTLLSMILAAIGCSLMTLVVLTMLDHSRKREENP